MADENLSLAPTDIVGVIQRGLRELDVYCSQSAANIDPHILLGYLGRLAEFAQRLPAVQHAHNGAAAEAGEARAN